MHRRWRAAIGYPNLSADDSAIMGQNVKVTAVWPAAVTRGSRKPDGRSS